MDLLDYLENRPLRAFLYSAIILSGFFASLANSRDGPYSNLSYKLAFSTIGLAGVFFTWWLVRAWRERRRAAEGDEAPVEDRNPGRTAVICTVLSAVFLSAALLRDRVPHPPHPPAGTRPTVVVALDPEIGTVPGGGSAKADAGDRAGTGGDARKGSPPVRAKRESAAPPPHGQEEATSTLGKIFTDAPKQILCNVSAGNLGCPAVAYWVRIGRHVPREGGTDLMGASRFRSVADIDAAVAAQREFTVDGLEAKACSGAGGPPGGACGNLALTGKRRALEKQEDDDRLVWVRVGGI